MFHKILMALETYRRMQKSRSSSASDNWAGSCAGDLSLSLLLVCI